MKSSWLSFFLGIIFLIIPVSGIVWWIYVAQTNPGDHYALVEQFMGPIPDFMGDARTFTWIEILFCGLAFWMFFTGIEAKGLKRNLNLVMLCFTGLIGFWLLFSLM